MKPRDRLTAEIEIKAPGEVLNMRLIKKTDVFLIIILAVIPVCMLAFNMISAMDHTETRLVILKDGDVYGTYPQIGRAHV